MAAIPVAATNVAARDSRYTYTANAGPLLEAGSSRRPGVGHGDNRIPRSDMDRVCESDAELPHVGS